MKATKEIISVIAHDLKKGCTNRYPQTDTTNGRTLDFCIDDSDCMFKGGTYELKKPGVPNNNLDRPLSKKTWSLCEIDNYTRIGPVAIPIRKK